MFLLWQRFLVFAVAVADNRVQTKQFLGSYLNDVHVLSSCKSRSLLLTRSEITVIATLCFSCFKRAPGGYVGPRNSGVVVTSWAVCMAVPLV